MPFNGLFSKINKHTHDVILPPRPLPASEANVLGLNKKPIDSLKNVGWYQVFEPDIPQYDSNTQYLAYSDYYFDESNEYVTRDITINNKSNDARITSLDSDYLNYIASKFTPDQLAILDSMRIAGGSGQFISATNEVFSWLNDIADYYAVRRANSDASWDFTTFDSTQPYTFQQLIGLRS